MPQLVRFFELKIRITQQILNKNQKYFILWVMGRGGSI